MSILKLKRHETFSIREGWIEKGIIKYESNGDSFKADLAPSILGIGSNMCKSLKYWLSATNLIDFKKGILSELGQFIFNYDKYLEDDFSWWMIHLQLARNFEDAPVINKFFNMNYQTFDKEFLLRYLKETFEQEGYEVGSETSLDSDVSVLLKSYISDDVSNPEDNMNCPLARLGLISTTNKRMYSKVAPTYAKLDYRIVYYSIVLCCGKELDAKDGFSFNLEDMYLWYNNPLKIFNLSKSSLYLYLEEMNKKGLIKFSKTAGLNTISIDNVRDLKYLFKNYFAEVK